MLLVKYYLFLFPSKTHKKFPSQLDKIGWFPSQLIKFISQPGIKLININERNNNDDNNNNTYINVAKCNLGKVNLETMLVCSFSCYTGGALACVQTITKLWLVPSAKQRRDPCSGPPTDSTNYRKCVSNSPSTWLAITTNKTKAFFNWPIVARTQIWVHSWKSRTRISTLFRRRS